MPPVRGSFKVQRANFALSTTRHARGAENTRHGGGASIVGRGKEFVMSTSRVLPVATLEHMGCGAIRGTGRAAARPAAARARGGRRRAITAGAAPSQCLTQAVSTSLTPVVTVVFSSFLRSSGRMRLRKKDRMKPMQYGVERRRRTPAAGGAGWWGGGVGPGAVSEMRPDAYPCGSPPSPRPCRT